MASSRLTITEDRTTGLFISLAQSIVLAGDRAFPKATASTVLALSKATRAALEAQEKEIATTLLSEVGKVLQDEKGIYAEAIHRKVEAIGRAVAWEPKK